VSVLESTRDYEDEEAELPNDVQEHGEPTVHFMENKADDRHQEDGWNKQESSEANIQLQPLPQPSIW
jgi:hypothetical protein